MEQPGCMTHVYSWTPVSGPEVITLITHHEAIAIADYLTSRGDNGSVKYRPTALYAYGACDEAVLSLQELMSHGFETSRGLHILHDDEIAPGGVDQVGVLLLGPSRGYWYSSTLSNKEAMRVARNNNATGLQVTSVILAAMKGPGPPKRGSGRGIRHCGL